MNLLSIITPVAPYHLALIERAAAQVAAQTMAATHIVIVDHDRRGAGWARNQGVARASTPFIAFLDADDHIMPDFSARLLAAWERGHYVYSDWLMSGEIQRMSDYGGLWDGLHHLINCLIHRADFLALGGFNETIEAEDTEFWLRAHNRGLCGKRAPYVLVEYTGDGQRSKTAQSDPQFWPRLAQLYKELPPMTQQQGCTTCTSVPGSPQPVGERQPDDVLVVTLWAGNQTRVGRATGRVYLRNGNGKQAWVDPRDLAQAPDWWQAVDAPVTPAEISEADAARINEALAKAEEALDRASLAEDVPAEEIKQETAAPVDDPKPTGRRQADKNK